MTFLKKTTVYIANFQTQNKLLVCHKQDYLSEYMSIAKSSKECRNKKLFAEKDYLSEYMPIAKYSNECRNKKFFAEKD